MIKKVGTGSDKIIRIFVYGTLRPDDNSKAPWTISFTQKLKFQKCYFGDGVMFFDEFPVVSLLYSDKDHYHNSHHQDNTIKNMFDNQLHKLYKDNNCNGIVGYCATVDETYLKDINNPDEIFDIFNEKLKEADEIEEYPHVYNRSIIKVKPFKNDTTNTIDHDNHMYCYIYHRQECNRNVIIPEGDWLKRKF